MGIIAFCPNGHRIKVKDELAGRKGICPTCAARFRIPQTSAGPEAAEHDDAGAPPTARVVSLDPLFAASLPAAFPLDEAETVAATGPAAGQGEGPPDFVLLEAEPAEDERPTAEPAASVQWFGARAAPYAALDERPELAWCVAVRGGPPSAPLAAAALRGWLESGAATGEHVVWRQDWPEWRPLPDVFPEALPDERPRWP